MRRWAIFNAVGVLGFLVQLGVLTLLLGAGLHYNAATIVAVEAAILHNFCWHTRWTWRDRSTLDLAARLWRFHFANGLISLVGNALAMWVLVGTAGVPPLPANLVAVVICAAANFVMSDRFVFLRHTGVHETRSNHLSPELQLSCEKTCHQNRRSKDNKKKSLLFFWTRGLL